MPEIWLEPRRLYGYIKTALILRRKIPCQFLWMGYFGVFRVPSD
jgi:hypothetical protein